MIYTVHVYATIRVKVVGVKANSSTLAIAAAQKMIDLETILKIDPPLNEPSVELVEFADEVTGFLVDPPNDPNHNMSVMFDQVGGKLLLSARIKDADLLKELAAASDTAANGINNVLRKIRDAGRVIE